MDLQVGTSPPSGTSYRLWPSYPTLPGVASGETKGYTLATEFPLSEACTLDKIWFYSPSARQRCRPGARSGMCRPRPRSPAPTTPRRPGRGLRPADGCLRLQGVTLPAGDYKVAVFYAGGSDWFMVTGSYWGTGGPAASGITAGPVTAPGSSAATSPGQSTYNLASWGYPLSYGSTGNGENFWVDVEVTPT